MVHVILSLQTFSRNSGRSLFNKSDPKRQTSRGHPTLPDLKVTPGSQPSSVPQSPLKAEFTDEPPKGALKAQPVRRAAMRELRFDRIPEGRSSHPLQSEKSLEKSVEKSLEKSVEIVSADADSSGNVIDGMRKYESAVEAVTVEALMQEFGDNHGGVYGRMFFKL